MSIATLTAPAVAPVRATTTRRRFMRTYRYVQRHPLGRWLLLLVWVGLGIALTTPYVALIPIALERRAVLRAAGVQIDRPPSHIPDDDHSQKETAGEMTFEQNARPGPMTATLDAVGTVDDDPTELYEMGITFTYDPADPYSLHLRIWALGEYESMRRWTVLRETVHVACAWGTDIAPPGADFSASVTAPGYVRLRFRNGNRCECGRCSSHMDLQVERAPLYAFMARTIEAVKPGTESQHMNFDAELEKLLAR